MLEVFQVDLNVQYLQHSAHFSMQAEAASKIFEIPAYLLLWSSVCSVHCPISTTVALLQHRKAYCYHITKFRVRLDTKLL